MLSSLARRLARLREHRPAAQAEMRDAAPGAEWKKYDEWVWERRVEFPPILPRRFDSTFILPEGLGSEDLRFYDLETTGLSGGSGNTAFLIGIAWQEGGHFMIAQLFLADYPGEQALLRRYRELCPEGHPQISYNGLSFDYQVLKTRFAINRMPLPHRRQVDLLYPTRRLWKTALSNFTLGTVERELLGVYRANDLPGREAPEAWFAWLRGHLNLIQGVFRHNIGDMISLAKLLVLLEQCGLWGAANEAEASPRSGHDLSRPRQASKALPGPLNGPPERWGSPGRFSSEQRPMAPRLPEWKMPSYRGIAHQWSLSDASRERNSLELGWAVREVSCGRELARRLKRERDYPASYLICKELYETKGDFVSAIELSKHLEHQMKNPAAALSVLESLKEPAPGIKGRGDLAHRRRRLSRKIARMR